VASLERVPAGRLRVEADGRSAAEVELAPGELREVVLER
jgi:hypothetical protein